MKEHNTTQYFDFKNRTDKHFFAGVLNTALNNFDLSIKELGKRIGVKNPNKGLLKTAFRDELTDADFNMRKSYLAESLNFINYMQYDDKQEFSEKLDMLYKTIDELRNFFTHYNREMSDLNPSIFGLLNDLLYQSAFQTKLNRAKSEEYKEFLTTKYKEDFDHIIAKKNKEIDEDNAKKKKGDRKLKHISKSDEINFVLNKVFKRFLYKKDGKDFLKNAASSKEKDKNELSINGFLQLLALFLNKKDFEHLLDHTKYFKDSRSLEFIASRWTLSYMCYRDIRKLIHSGYSNDSLLLQMCAELSKCPKELYDLISKQKKGLFVDELQKNKRYENKFPYFALRFLDEMIDFPSLRFQVSLGRFQHSTEKKSKNTKFETERRILEQITVFERLSTVTNKKKEYFLNKDNEGEDNDWQKYPMPSYQFNRNNIGIYLNINSSSESNALQERENNKPSKFEIADKLGLKYSLKKPIAYLSINELPALLYELLVKGKEPLEIENSIKNKINLQRRLIGKYPNIEDQERVAVPKQLRSSKTDQEYIDKTKLLCHIEKEKNKDPLEKIRKEKKSRSRGKKELSDHEKGKIATWLTDDIKRFCSKETRAKIKGHQVSTLQAMMAFYEIRKNDIKTYLFEEMQLDANKDDPFLGINLSKDSLYAFYKHYIGERQKFLANLYYEIEKNNINKDHYIFNYFKLNLYLIRKLDPLKKTYQTEVPFNLPRGVFDDKPTFSKNDKEKEFAEWFRESSNINEAQSFYYFDKYHKINGSEKNQRIETSKGLKQQYKDKLSTQDQKKIYKREKQIRKIMREDFFVKEMVKFQLKKALNETDIDSLSLKDFFNKNDDSSNVLSKKIKLRLLNGKIEGDVKIKDIGKYRRFEADVRVLKLVEYYQNEDHPLTIDQISSEIEAYDRIRNFNLFFDVHQLEDSIFQKAIKENNTDKLKRDGKLNFKKFIAFQFIDDHNLKDYFDELIIENQNVTDLEHDLEIPYLITKIRNKFSHNQLLPLKDYQYLNSKLQKENDELIADHIYRFFKKHINIWIS